MRVKNLDKNESSAVDYVAGESEARCLGLHVQDVFALCAVLSVVLNYILHLQCIRLTGYKSCPSVRFERIINSVIQSRDADRPIQPIYLCGNYKYK